MINEMFVSGPSFEAIEEITMLTMQNQDIFMDPLNAEKSYCCLTCYKNGEFILMLDQYKN